MTNPAGLVSLGAVRAAVKWVTAVLLILTLGLHWAVLQTVAWAGMAVVYVQQAGVRQGLAMTFDGRHPCPLCKAIEKGRAEEQPQDQKPLKPGSKLDPTPLWTAEEFDFRQPAVSSPPLQFRWPTRTDPPPKPRPRFSLA